jgi:glucokinase
MILAGDIGGTKTNVALFRESDLSLIHNRSFPSQNYPGLWPILEEFLQETKGDISNACFGVAGPVNNGISFITNLSWTIEATALRENLNCTSVHLINDLEANGWGIEVLPQSSFHVLREGTPKPGNAALISAGTGLGECCLFWNGTRHIPSASEGGHASFAPRNEEEVELLRYLWKQYAHVSWERVVSGSMGFQNIYNFYRDTQRAIEPPELAEKIQSGDPAAIISQSASQDIDIAVKTMEMFFTLYGAEAGNLALKIIAVSGVYIGGGIAPKNLKWMTSGNFLDSFSAKGRFTSMLEEIPVKIILDSQTALYGAARFAQIKGE